MKRIVGEPIEVWADVYRDGHDVTEAALIWRREDERKWRRAQMIHHSNDRWFASFVPEEIGRYLIHKGSIALDGISLTIAALEPGPLVTVAVIPHTYANTTIGHTKPGARLNIEVDLLAKYIEKLLKADS